MIDFKEIDNRPLIILYQLKDSPLEELKTKTREDGYDSVTNFYLAHKSSSVSPALITKIIKKNNLEMQPVLYEKGLIKGYKIADLERLCLKESNEDVVQLTLPLKQSEIRRETRRKRKDSKLTRKRILEVLESDLNKGMSSLEITKKIKDAGTSTIQNNLKLLKDQKKIKIVDLTEPKGPSGFCGFMYQSMKSPLPAIAITKNFNKYGSLKRFYSKYKKYAIPKEEAEEVIEKANITKVPLMLSGKVFYAYDMDDLKRVLFVKGIPTDITTMEPETKSILQERKKAWNKISNFFKKKEKFDQEFISF